jgi:hypothetical protein
MQEIKLEKIEALYINPKWKSSKVGDFLTSNKKKKKNETLTQMKASSKFDSQKDKVDYKIEPKAKESDSSGDEKTQ